MLICPFT